MAKTVSKHHRSIAAWLFRTDDILPDPVAGLAHQSELDKRLLINEATLGPGDVFIEKERLGRRYVYPITTLDHVRYIPSGADKRACKPHWPAYRPIGDYEGLNSTLRIAHLYRRGIVVANGVARDLQSVS